MSDSRRSQNPDERPDDERPDDERPDDERPDDERPDDERPDSVEGSDFVESSDRTKASLPTQLPGPAVGRASLYFRELHRLRESKHATINSQQLGRLVNVSPAVVRRDLSALGTVGRRGVGYSVQTLIERIGEVLGSGQQWEVVLIGVGSLGDALLRYRGFERLGFTLTDAFDVDPVRIGTTVGGIKIRDAAEMESRFRQRPPNLAILAIPAEKAADVANQLVSLGVCGLLNFAPVTLRLPPRIAVVNVDLASELQRLAFAVQSGR
ncbi:redox-sensing transcriptional repressor Rex [Novipirellula artificiosorum]|uniref:Redox-sensing transcriptional repressor Rex n=1 Tax=Novipirellula artificiosorum TaxID=2528016 RepID=A0A5C6DEE4_9BACT|nr:redox-sensing transcriptional repressor Rex [Novipirellula artificiosorum]TWU33299.1 Redox-sensing transcriptional repressor Rex [Novipirellula artificiosorum]